MGEANHPIRLLKWKHLVWLGTAAILAWILYFIFFLPHYSSIPCGPLENESTSGYFRQSNEGGLEPAEDQPELFAYGGDRSKEGIDRVRLSCRSFEALMRDLEPPADAYLDRDQILCRLSFEDRKVYLLPPPDHEMNVREIGTFTSTRCKDKGESILSITIFGATYIRRRGLGKSAAPWADLE